MRKHVLFLLVAVLALALSACQPAQTTNNEIPVTGEETPAVGTDNTMLPLVTQLVQERLAVDLGVAPADVEVTAAEPAEWTDSCLGLGGPEESCLQVITPGWLLVADVNGQEYEVRASENGTEIRYTQ